MHFHVPIAARMQQALVKLANGALQMLDRLVLQRLMASCIFFVDSRWRSNASRMNFVLAPLENLSINLPFSSVTVYSLL